MQQPLARPVADEARAGGDEVRAVAQRPGERAGEPGARPRVRVERDHHVAGRRLEPLLQRPRLADPAGRELAARDDAGAVCARHARRGVGRAVVDDDHLVDVGVAGQPGEAGRETGLLVARRDHDADAPVRAPRDERRAAPATAREAREDHGRGAGLGDMDEHGSSLPHGVGTCGATGRDGRQNRRRNQTLEPLA